MLVVSHISQGESTRPRLPYEWFATNIIIGYFATLIRVTISGQAWGLTIESTSCLVSVDHRAMPHRPPKSYIQYGDVIDVFVIFVTHYIYRVSLSYSIWFEVRWLSLRHSRPSLCNLTFLAWTSPYCLLFFRGYARAVDAAKVTKITFRRCTVPDRIAGWSQADDDLVHTCFHSPRCFSHSTALYSGPLTGG